MCNLALSFSLSCCEPAFLAHFFVCFVCSFDSGSSLIHLTSLLAKIPIGKTITKNEMGLIFSSTSDLLQQNLRLSIAYLKHSDNIHYIFKIGYLCKIP